MDIVSDVVKNIADRRNRNVQWIWGTASMGKTATIRYLYEMLSDRAPRSDTVIMLQPGMDIPYAGIGLCQIVSQVVSAAKSLPVVLLIDDAHLLDRWWESAPDPVRRGQVKLVCTTGLRLRYVPPSGDLHVLWYPPAHTPLINRSATFAEIIKADLTPPDGWWEHYRLWCGHPPDVTWSWRALSETLTQGAPRTLMDGKGLHAVPDGWKSPYLANRMPLWMTHERLQGLAGSNGTLASEWDREAGLFKLRWAEAAGMVHIISGYRNSGNMVWFRSPVALMSASDGKVNQDRSVAVATLGMLADAEHNGRVSYYPASISPYKTGPIIYQGGQPKRELWSKGSPSTTLVAFTGESSRSVKDCERVFRQDCLVRSPAQVAYAAALLMLSYRKQSARQVKYV